MTRLSIRSFVAVSSILVGWGFVGCSGGSINASDCSVHCREVENQCTTKCTDDACKNKCSTEAEDCTASCGKISTGGAGGSG
jgi:hypothetical protein